MRLQAWYLMSLALLTVLQRQQILHHHHQDQEADGHLEEGLVAPALAPVLVLVAPVLVQGAVDEGTSQNR
jgi:hypothetical protein